jgi:hypothetical protein
MLVRPQGYRRWQVCTEKAEPVTLLTAHWPRLPAAPEGTLLVVAMAIIAWGCGDEKTHTQPWAASPRTAGYSGHQLNLEEDRRAKSDTGKGEEQSDWCTSTVIACSL